MSSHTPETNVDAGTMPTERASGFSLDIEEKNLGQAVRDWVTRLRSGQPGALPSVIGLVVLAAIFNQVSGAFLTSYNFGNIPGQGAYIAVIALGLVFVLLLGEIDLSAGTAGGTCAAFAAVAVKQGSLHDGLPTLLFWALVVGMVLSAALAVWLRAWSAAVVIAVGDVLIVSNLTSHLGAALIAAVCIGTAIGVFNGYLVAKVGIPSFVVTLALFLAWQGVLQFALQGQSISTTKFQFWHDLSHGNLSPFWSWVFILVVTLGYVAYTLLRSIRAKAAGLAHEGLDLVLVRGGLVIAATSTRSSTGSRSRPRSRSG
jgi:D-xylose transport system permease protein